MVNPGDVFLMLCPNAKVALVGDKYEDINWFGAKPAITKAEYEAGFAQYDAWKAEQESTKATQRQAILDRLGLTSEEARLLLS